MRKKAYLFDLDGVLVDTKELHWESWKVLASRHKEFSMNREEFLKSFGKTNQYILEELLPNFSDEERKAFGDEKEAIFRTLPIDQLKLLPGVLSFLKQIEKEGVPRIIASSTPVANLDALLSKTELGEHFQEYVSAEQVKRGKPYPDVFEEAARRLGARPEESVVIEDSQAGIDAGKAAGCMVIAVTTTHPKEKLLHYDVCVDRLDELELSRMKG